MRTMLWLAVVAVRIPPSAGLADEENRRCWDCLKRLAMEFPAKNPQEDPFFEDALPPNSAVGAFIKYSLDDSEISVLQQVINVFTDTLFRKDGVSYVREHLKGIPNLSDEDRAKLVDGARQDLSTTLGFITNRNCRILFQSQLNIGASRAWLLQVVQAGRTRQMSP